MAWEVADLSHLGFYQKKNIFQSFYKRPKAKEDGVVNSMQHIEGSFYRAGRDTPMQRESSIETSEEFRQLNALKKKFKRAFKLDDSLDGMSRKRAASVIQEEGDEQGQPIDTAEELDDLYNEVELDYKIDFKVEKKLNPKNFIFDLHSKKEHLSELLNLLQIILECGSVDINLTLE